jgi:hypothetical protein
MRNELHEEVFQFCEAYRSQHPEFRYWLRSKNSKERLDNGFWFQGTEKYAFVGLYDRNSGNLSTKSIGLVFFPGKAGIECDVQNVFKSEKEPAVISLYEDIRNLMGEFKKKSDTIYFFTFKGKTGFEAATYFLDNYKSQIDKLIHEKGLDSMFISKEEFQQKLNRINEFRNKLFTVPTETDTSTHQSSQQNLLTMQSNIPLNQIFFGPPGTGKTYQTVNEAVRIADPDFYVMYNDDRIKLQERFNELIIKDWEEPRGQIAFTTFHQSFSYEDFVEGIKPLKPEENDTFLKYKVEQGIFQSICKMAEASINAKQISEDNIIAFSEKEFNNAIFYKISLGNSLLEEDRSIYEYCINNKVIAVGFAKGINFTGLDEEEVYQAVEKAELKRVEAEFINRFITAPKVGNYVLVSNGNNYIRAFAKITGEYVYNPDTEIKFEHFRKVEWIFKDVEIPVSEFYQKKLSQQTIYKLNSDFIIPSFFIKKAKSVVGKKKNYVLIIDEINRGNVSSIFGELITLIEAKKRAGQTEALQVVLPYSKTPFKVPDNVYIIGTMNTADRSIEALDTALRRRFSFVHMEPKSSFIKDYGKSKGQIEGVDMCLILDKINERIEKLIDKDHRIGHSYFMDAVTVDDLKLVFRDAILPLLQEYFFGDNGKIGLVLGSSFIEKVKDDSFEFAAFADYDGTITDDLKRRSIYIIKPESDWDFISIYET